MMATRIGGLLVLEVGVYFWIFDRYSLVKIPTNRVSPALIRHQNFLGGPPPSNKSVP